MTGTRYQWSLATFTVPNAFTPQGYSNSESSYWAGVGASGPIIQDGVDITTTGSVQSFHAWVDYQPDGSRFDNDFTVRAGGSMTFWAWECDVNANVTVRGGYGCYWYKNNMTGVAIDQSDTARIQLPSGFRFDGEGAEAIVERICTQTQVGSDGKVHCTQAIPLSNFNLVSVEFAAVDSNSAWHNLASDHCDWYTMKNYPAGQTLANAQHYGGDDVELLGWAQAQ